jgi:glycosyltransferase involved in cell wall biosynthesis
MACECAVIASDVGAIPEAIENGQNGILISPGDADALSRNIITLLEDEDLRKKLGREARTSVADRFSWKKSAQKMTRIYESIIA